MKRMYRLPGSREVWHIDSGPGTFVFDVRGFQSFAPCKSVDIGGDNVPRAWIQFDNDVELHIIGGNALWHVVATVSAVDAVTPVTRDSVVAPVLDRRAVDGAAE